MRLSLISKIQRFLLRELFKLFEPKRGSLFSNSCKEILWPRRSIKYIDQYKCIFVHIPKCAGISISQSLFGEVSKAHRSIQEYKSIYPAKDFSEYFKFTFVRNPWDRLVSSFIFLRNGGMNIWDKKWASLNLLDFKDFDSFVHGWLRRENITSWFHFIPQYQYIYLKNGTIPLNFIGSYENLNDDFDYLCDRFSINVELLRLNVSPLEGNDYRKYYTAETRRIVAEVYAEDIAMLGYSFDFSIPNICKKYDAR